MSNSNWLSFSLSSLEMNNSISSSSESSQNHNQQQLIPYQSLTNSSQFLMNELYGANYGWMDQGSSVFYTQGRQNHNKNVHVNPTSLSFLTMMNSHHGGQQVPKQEDFYGGDTSTQDSSLTQLYDHNNSSAYFTAGQQSLKAITGFQAFSANSSSEVDDSASMGKTHLTELAGQSTGSSGTELAFANNTQTGALSLAVNNQSSQTEKAIVTAEPADNTKKPADTFGQRTSIYRGVTRHRWTGRYEAHLWDNSSRREGQARKGRQVYLGGYDKEDKAARAYDLAALKYWGTNATTNFPISTYTKELEEMKNVSKQEFIASLRRRSSGFSRGASIYRGVTRHHQQGRWQARIGRVAGNKDLYLGTFATEEEAAEAYDIAAIKFRGASAVTNFELSRYDIEAIMRSPLPIGSAAKRQKMSPESEEAQSADQGQLALPSSGSNNISFAAAQPISSIPCGVPYDPAAAYRQHLLHQLQFTNVSNSNYPGSAMSVTAPPPIPMLPQPTEYLMWPPQPNPF